VPGPHSRGADEGEGEAADQQAGHPHQGERRERVEARRRRAAHPAQQRVDPRPGDRADRGQANEAGVRHAQRPGEERDERVHHREELHQHQDVRGPTAHQPLGLGPAFRPDEAAEPAVPDAGTEAPAQQVAE
jgi:hypothetical protein